MVDQFAGIKATLGGVPFRINPDAVQWSFNMKIAETKTLGGKVIQILGTKQTSMRVAGDFGSGDRNRGDREGWEEQRRFVNQVVRWTSRAESGGKPLEFVYTPRNWHMDVYVEAFASKEGDVELHNTNINPSWVLTLFVVQDRSRVVVKGIRDLYIKRLMDGIGWKQTEYNGPTQAEVDALLQGRTLGEYMGEQAQSVFENGLPTDNSGLPQGTSGGDAR